MPSAALSYKRSSRKSSGVNRRGLRLADHSASPPGTCNDCGCHCHNHLDSKSLKSSNDHEKNNRPGKPIKDTCYLCKKSIRYFTEQLSCGHLFHAECYWFWISVRTNVPEERSICPKCGFLEPVRPAVATKARHSGRSKRKESTSSTSSSSSSGRSDTGHLDLFFL